jgi:DNA repair protein RadC
MSNVIVHAAEAHVHTVGEMPKKGSQRELHVSLAAASLLNVPATHVLAIRKSDAGVYRIESGSGSGSIDVYTAVVDEDGHMSLFRGTRRDGIPSERVGITKLMSAAYDARECGCAADAKCDHTHPATVPVLPCAPDTPEADVWPGDKPGAPEAPAPEVVVAPTSPEPAGSERWLFTLTTVKAGHHVNSKSSAATIRRMKKLLAKLGGKPIDAGYDAHKRVFVVAHFPDRDAAVNAERSIDREYVSCVTRHTPGVVEVTPASTVVAGEVAAAEGTGGPLPPPVDYTGMNKALRGKTIRDAYDVDTLVRPYFKGASQEHITIICLDVRQRVIDVTPVGLGPRDRTELDPADVVGIVTAKNAENGTARPVRSWVIFHLHPSGEPTPSPADQALTATLERTFSAQTGLEGIPMADHIILGLDGTPPSFASYANNWRVFRSRK